MDRYKWKIKSGKEFELHDTRYGDTVVAVFRDFGVAQQVIEYLNMKERYINTLLKHASQDLDYEFFE